MMKLFRRYILGGLSDKTEATLFAFLIAVGMAGFVIWKVAEGQDMSAVTGMVSAFLLATVTAVTGATIAGHLKPAQSATGLREDGQGGYPDGGWLPENETPPAGANGGRTVI